MSRSTYLVRLGFFFCFVSLTARLPADALKVRIGQLATNYLSDPRTASLVIGVYRAGSQVPEVISYGEIRKGSGIAPTGATLYKLGSIGKTFTATCLADYVVNHPGKAALGDPINRFFPTSRQLPFWLPPGQSQEKVSITLLNLATHYSSLPDQPPNFVTPPGYTNERLLAFAGSDDPSFHVRPLRERPGTSFIYSNTGFGLLGVVMERISGLPYQEMLQHVFCNELKMNDTRVALNEEQKSRLATGYSNGTAVPLAVPTSPGFYGAGGNYSSMDNMMEYLAWNMGIVTNRLSSLLPVLHAERMHTARTNAWVGLAWQMNFLNPGSPRKYIWKDGGTTGYSCIVGFVPETRTGVMVLSNASGSGLACDSVGIAVLRALNSGQ